MVKKTPGRKQPNLIYQYRFARARTLIDLDAVKPCVFFTTTWRDGPHLTWLKGIATNAVFALQLWSRDKFFYTIGTHRVAEVSIAEFRRADGVSAVL